MDEEDLEDLFNAEFPKAGDSTFVSRGRAVADLSYGGEFSYAVSYKRAADLLVQEAKKNPVEVDFVGHPTVFLYRHYLELSLKDFNTRLGNSLWGHDLMKLWNSIRNCIDERKESEDCDGVESMLKEWAGYDSRSSSFRYPTKNKVGDRSLPENLAVSLEHMSEQVQKIDNFFTGLDGDLHHHHDC